MNVPKLIAFAHETKATELILQVGQPATFVIAGKPQNIFFSKLTPADFEAQVLARLGRRAREELRADGRCNATLDVPDLGSVPVEVLPDRARFALGEPASPPQVRPARKSWHSPSALLLIVTNLVPVAGVLFLGWPAFSILLLFWVEIGIVCVTTFLRMLFWAPGWVGKLILLPVMLPFMIGFPALFAGFYYFLAIIVLLFLPPDVAEALAPFVAAAREEAGSDRLLPHGVMALVLARSDLAMQVSIAMLAASHLFSFGYNYLYRGECWTMDVGGLILLPFVRLWLVMVPMGFAIVGIAYFGIAQGSMWLLLPLIALKTAADLYSHLREHGAGFAEERRRALSSSG